MAADIVSLGDSWLNYAINDGLIEPMHEVKNQSWLNDLSDAWKVRCLMLKNTYIAQ